MKITKEDNQYLLNYEGEKYIRITVDHLIEMLQALPEEIRKKEIGYADFSHVMQDEDLMVCLDGDQVEIQ